ncbi:NACHT domain-containing protein [Trebonia kvetii]|uniref:NACHT domain-containing protein n=1 Tax=Trebonia kvetii TaxID=2480626 RepID=UPI0016525670|nr:NACHT domain-containing protein [Trebonia kvetii]
MADKLADAAIRWFKRFRKTDDLSRLVKAAAGTSIDLNDAEFKAVRKLLEKEPTWNLLAAGKLNEKAQGLNERIAELLPPRDDRTAEDARAAAAAIARGLLEFAVFDLQPEIFQRVVLARLQQMSDQASALDQALFRIHEDLYHLVDDARDLFKLVSDRMPQRPATLSEIKIYLRTLIDWLNSDPWPQDPRLGGPPLTPATIERKLRVSATGLPHEPEQEQEADADELARQCSRLVILGGPGSGKTWLAKRAARLCAEAALDALTARAGLDEVELPLYTTCARLISTPGDIRQAAVSSAIEPIGDLGGSRIVKALCLFFTERDTRTLLVIDSLDEASDLGEARERLRQADSLRHPWRVVLTSRPSSWDNQLKIEDTSQDHRVVGALRPLQYPHDVEHVIQQWFAARPERGQALAAQIAGRPSLQHAATVPLILAFYCILGGGQSLPEFRYKLYEQVINRMLRAPWRSSSVEPPDPRACRAVLRTWAWQEAKDHPVSGVGQWEDDISTLPARVSTAGQIAVDHVAPPLGGPDFDTDKTSRRFVHRSIREYLVAEHVALMSADEAAGELLKHLWYDPDWEYTAPAALAMHPRRDQVLKELICQAAQSECVPDDLASIDGCWELRRFLTRVAEESLEDSWMAESAAIIGRARLDVAAFDPFHVAAAHGWPTTDSQIRGEILAHIEATNRSPVVAGLAQTLNGLQPKPRELARARSQVLNLLASARPYDVPNLETALRRLNPHADDLARARSLLLDQLDATSTGTVGLDVPQLAGALCGLDPQPGDLARARSRVLHLLEAANPDDLYSLADVLGWLGSEPGELARARGRVLDVLEAIAYDIPGLAAALRLLSPKPRDLARARARVLDLLDTDRFPTSLADLLVTLGPEPEDLVRARGRVLDLLDAAEPWAALFHAMTLAKLNSLDPAAAKTLDETAEMLRGLNLDLAELCRARGRVLHLFDMAHVPFDVLRLTIVLLGFKPEPDDLAKARSRVLDLLDAAEEIGELTDSLVRLDPEPGELARARRRVLDLLRAHRPPWVGELVAALLKLGPEPSDLAQARSRVLRLLDSVGPRGAKGLAGVLGGLNPAPDELAQARSQVLHLIEIADPKTIKELTDALGGLNPAPDELAQARSQVLHLIEIADPKTIKELTDALGGLNPAPDELAQARSQVLHLIEIADPKTIKELTDMLDDLNPAPDELAQARSQALHLIDSTSDGTDGWRLAEMLALLNPEPSKLARARRRILHLLDIADRNDAWRLTRVLAELSPAADDLACWSSWAEAPDYRLLAAVRRNSPLRSWLQVLPVLDNLPASTQPDPPSRSY